MTIIPPDTQQRDWEPILIDNRFYATDPLRLVELIKSIEDQAYARGIADMKEEAIASVNGKIQWYSGVGNEPIRQAFEELKINLNNI